MVDYCYKLLDEYLVAFDKTGSAPAVFSPEVTKLGCQLQSTIDEKAMRKIYKKYKATSCDEEDLKSFLNTLRTLVNQIDGSTTVGRIALYKALLPVLQNKRERNAALFLLKKTIFVAPDRLDRSHFIYDLMPMIAIEDLVAFDVCADDDATGKCIAIKLAGIFDGNFEAPYEIILAGRCNPF